MINADIFFVSRKNFYNPSDRGLAAYERVFEILTRFKKAFFLVIHTMHSKDNSFQVVFKSDYWITFKEIGENWYVELYSGINDYDDFKEMMVKLEEIIKQV